MRPTRLFFLVVFDALLWLQFLSFWYVCGFMSFNLSVFVATFVYSGLSWRHFLVFWFFVVSCFCFILLWLFFFKFTVCCCKTRLFLIRFCRCLYFWVKIPVLILGTSFFLAFVLMSMFFLQFSHSINPKNSKSTGFLTISRGHTENTCFFCFRQTRSFSNHLFFWFVSWFFCFCAFSTNACTKLKLAHGARVRWTLEPKP